MHVCVYVCIYSLYCLFIIYVTGAYSKHCFIFSFLWKYSSRKITDLSLCLVPLSASSGPFLWSHSGSSAMTRAWAGSWRGWFNLRVPAAGSSDTSCGTPGDALQGWQWGQGDGHCEMQCLAPWSRASHTPWPWGKPPPPPRELGPETAASCWQCQSSEAERHSRLFWLKIGQDLIEMKEHFW